MHFHMQKSVAISALVITLVVIHAIVLYRLSSYLVWTVVPGLMLLVILKHLGLLGSVYACLRRRRFQ